MSNLSGVLRLKGRVFEFAAEVDHDPGCRTLRNGDPGWPETWEVLVESLQDVTEEDSPKDCLDWYERDDVFQQDIDQAIMDMWQDDADGWDEPEWDAGLER